MTTRSAGRRVPLSSSTASTRPVPTIALVLARVMHLDAARLDGALQEMAGGGIELALHQGRHQVHDRDVHALRLQAGGGFQAQQAAADDHGIAARLGGQQHGLDVVEVAVGQHARQVVAGHRDDDRDWSRWR